MFNWVKNLLIGDINNNTNIQDKTRNSNTEFDINNVFTNDVNKKFEEFINNIRTKHPLLFNSKWFYKQNHVLSHYCSRIIFLKTIPIEY